MDAAWVYKLDPSCATLAMLDWLQRVATVGCSLLPMAARCYPWLLLRILPAEVVTAC